jgi:hypothetical protein
MGEMPRNPRDEPRLVMRERQKKYRARLAAIRRPEDVDTVMAAALTRLCLSIEGARPGKDDPIRKAL